MKPVIVVCGANHSGTSLTAKLLIDNGAWIGATDSGPTDKTPYEKYEDEAFRRYIQHVGGISTDYPNAVEEFGVYVSNLPDEVVVLKHPKAVFFLNNIRNLLPREMRVVFCLREMAMNVQSIMNKTGMRFMDAVEEWNKYYYNSLLYNGKLHYTSFERLMNHDDEIIKLMDFCGLEFTDKSAINPEKVTCK